jgi:segregation and condensation protein B
MGRRPKAKVTLDTTLTDLPTALRWREWMGRVEAVIFASPEPVTRAMLAKVVGPDCNLDLIIDDIQAELRGRPYELVAVAGGWQHRTRKQFADAIRTATGAGEPGSALSASEMQVLLCVGYFQPITRGELGKFFGKEISRDVIGHLRRLDLIGSGPGAAARRALHLCDDQGLPGAVRVRHAARPAGHRGARRRRPAQQGQAVRGGPESDDVIDDNDISSKAGLIPEFLQVGPAQLVDVMEQRPSRMPHQVLPLGCASELSLGLAIRNV